MERYSIKGVERMCFIADRRFLLVFLKDGTTVRNLDD